MDKHEPERASMVLGLRDSHELIAVMEGAVLIRPKEIKVSFLGRQFDYLNIGGPVEDPPATAGEDPGSAWAIRTFRDIAEIPPWARPLTVWENWADVTGG